MHLKGLFTSNAWYMFIRLKFIVLFLCTFSSFAFAKETFPQIYFNHLTNNDGLSSSKVNCIYEDTENYIWFGTEDGLNLFDGITIRVFKNDPDDSTSISNNAVSSIICDPTNGNLWIGTRKGINYFDKSTFCFRRMFDSQKNDNGINDHIINDLKFDWNGFLWIATSNGLYQYRPQTDELIPYTHHRDDPSSIVSDFIQHVFIDNDERILLSTKLGVDLLDYSNNNFIHLFGDHNLQNVMRISKDFYGEYWICTDEMGLYNASYQNGFTLTKFNDISNNDLHTSRIHSVVEDKLHNLFFVARDKGLFYYNRQKNSITIYEPDIFDTRSLSSKALISSFYSSSGILWLGTFNRGINYIDINRKSFQHFKINYQKTGLFNNNVRSFFQDSDGNIWIGTKEGGGLSLFSSDQGTFVNFRYDEKEENSFSSDYILAINELNDSVLILGTLGEGIDLFNKNTHRVTNYKIGSQASENKVYSIFKDANDAIWIATLNGLFQYNRLNHSFYPVEDVHAVKCFAQIKEDEIWMGTRFNGIVLWKAGNIIEFSEIKGLAPITRHEVTSLRFVNDSILWIGTTSGLNKLNLNNLHLSSWNESDGLSSNRIAAIEIDSENQIWVSTSNGISMFNPLTNIFKNYYVEDGLQGNDFESYISLKANDGKLYFGGGNGFNAFDPIIIKDNLLVPNIQFTDFKIANQSVAIQAEGSPLKRHINQTSKIVLNHTQSDFTFGFVALNYTSPENNSYRYKLEGYDNDWISAGNNRFATYTNITAGDYIFRVTGSNNDNIWNETGRSIQMIILPPPWKSKWAYILYLIVIGLLVMGFYFVIVYRIEQQSLLRMERHEREKIELLNQLKLRFFTNISHEFRTPLTLISSPLSRLMNKSDISLTERNYLYSTMHKNVLRLLRLLKQLMDFRKLENSQMDLKVQQGNLLEFIQDICTGFHDFSINKSIDIQFDGNPDGDKLQWFDHNIVDSVIFNLLSNAIKFSEDNSIIKIKSKIENGKATIEIIDHGVGIPPDKIDKIFERFYSDNSGPDMMTGTGIGLSFSKSLIALHKGEISVCSTCDIETSFKVEIPINKEDYESYERITSSGEIELRKSYDANAYFEHEAGPIANKISGKGIKLLVVEDNVELRKFLKNNLSGFSVSEAGDGLEALELANEFVPDLVISDVMMPRMDGVQFCSALKSNFITSHIPVILLTAKTANEHKIEGMDSGADAYIEKPFDMDVLEAQIWNLIKQRERLRKRFSNQFEVQPEEVASSVVDKHFFQKAERIVSDNISNQRFSVEDFGAALNMSRSQLFRKFKAITDCTPSDYIRAERIKEAKKLLSQGEYNVNEISFKAGFNSPSHFIATFKKYTGLTPREYRLK